MLILAMTALENCSVELRDATDAVLFSTMTDATGYYEFTGLLDGDYTLVTTSATAYTYVTEPGRCKRFVKPPFRDSINWCILPGW